MNKANKSGQFLENRVENFFVSKKIEIIRYKDFNELDCFHPKCLIKRVPFIDVFGRLCYTEFVFHNEFGTDVRIECKNQDVRGSKEQALCYFLDSVPNMPESLVCLLITGDGWDKKLLKSLTTKHSSKLKIFIGFESFSNYFNEILE